MGIIIFVGVFFMFRPYPFIKPSTHFDAKEVKIRLRDKADHHSISEIFKNLKIGSSSERTLPWIKVLNESHEKKYQERLIRTAILAGEISSFLDPIYSVKTRGLHDDKTNQFNIISKEIEKGMNFFNYFKKFLKKDLAIEDKKWVYKGNNFKEGLARSDIFSLLFQEGDYHFGNLYVNEKEYCKRIDFDRCFLPVTKKFISLWARHQFAFPKYPLLTVDSYEHLPIIDKDLRKTKKHWQWTDTDPETNAKSASLVYAESLTKSEEYLNEKHFYALKFLVTSFYVNHLIKYHINNDEDNNEIAALFKEIKYEFLNICKQSDSFKTYFQKNHKEAIKAIIFEVYEFFQKNKHYMSKNPTLAEKNLDNIIQGVLSGFSQVPGIFGEKELEAFQIVDLTETTKKIKSHSNDMMNEVIHFYQSQKMTHYAGLASKYIKPELQLSDEKNSDSSRITTLPKTTPLVEAEKASASSSLTSSSLSSASQSLSDPRSLWTKKCQPSQDGFSKVSQESIITEASTSTIIMKK
jgi:hypothetical protein